MDTTAWPVPTRFKPCTRYRPVGALRLALAVMVVAQHFQHLLPPAQRVVFHQLGLGLIAVTVFFVISGFVVTEAAVVFYDGRPAAFLLNRVLRLLPPYLAALALSVLGHAALWWTGKLSLWDFPSPAWPLSSGALISGLCGLIPGIHPAIFGQTFEFIPYSWSLRVEMAFYLAAALCIAAARPWPAVVPTVLAICLVASFILLPGAHASLLSNMPMFLAGIALYGAVTRCSPARLLFAALACAAACLGFGTFDQRFTPDLAQQFLVLGLLLLLFAALCTLSASGAWQRFDRELGDLSYPLYLNHYIIGIALSDLAPTLSWRLYAMAATLSLCLAWLMGRLIDTQTLRLRARIRKTRLE